ncbi:hypothetical protein [Ruminiclostridium cellobioparum]|jgi:hypothetical protein|nr:hypothetical protein [Ruminiclostridium cellobioparum]
MNKSITSKEKSKIAFDKQADHYDSTYYGQQAMFFWSVPTHFTIIPIL